MLCFSALMCEAGMKELSPLQLAFLGDAIHTLFVRMWAHNICKAPMNQVHKICAKYCSAVHQSEVLSSLQLQDDEQEIVRRARNAKAKHSAKNAEVKDYKLATAFEALVGYLQINNKEERLLYVLDASIKDKDAD